MDNFQERVISPSTTRSHCVWALIEDTGACSLGGQAAVLLPQFFGPVPELRQHPRLQFPLLKVQVAPRGYRTVVVPKSGLFPVHPE